MIQSVTVETSQITLPFEVFEQLKGKEIRFVKSEKGFLIQPVRNFSENKEQSFKLANLRRRKLINGDPEELVNLKVSEWNELKNL
jgi:hypothetical protein